MHKIDEIVIRGSNYFSLLVLRRDEETGERGSISLETALITSVLVVVAIAITAKITKLGASAQNKIPTKL